MIKTNYLIFKIPTGNKHLLRCHRLYRKIYAQKNPIIDIQELYSPTLGVEVTTSANRTLLRIVVLP